MKKSLLICVIVFCVFIAGCADIEIPKTSQLIKNPLPNTVRVGMTKDQVVDIYGDPNIKDTVVSDKWAGTREEWIYKAEMSALPVSTNYLGEDLYLYFDGDNLTNVSKEPLGKEAKLKR